MQSKYFFKMTIQNQIIVITGGATGIGLALVKHFIADNQVISIDRNLQKIETLQKQVPKVKSIKADISKKEETNEAIKQISKDYGKIDMLINNAGIGKYYNFEKTMETELIEIVESEITTNFISPIILSKKCLLLLSKSNSPKIVFISTGLAYMPDAGSPTYCSSKAGLHFFAMSLRHQLKDTKIKVIEVLPAAVDTDFSKGIDVPKISTEKFVKSFISKLGKGQTTINIGMAVVLNKISRFFPTFAFNIINSNKKKK